MPPSFISSSPDELLQRVIGLDDKQPGGRHRGAQTVAWRAAGVGQGDGQHAEKGFVRVGQVLLVFFGNKTFLAMRIRIFLQNCSHFYVVIRQ